MSLDAVTEEYTRIAASYDRRWAVYVRETVARTLPLLRLHPGGKLLDLGCGTGTLLQTLAGLGTDLELFGVDACRPMLDVASRRLGGRVTLAVASVDRLPFCDASFDLAVSTSAFHYFPHPEAALVELRRVLRPGGRVVITDWCRDYWSCRACDALLRLGRRAHARTLGSKECRSLLEKSGFAVESSNRFRVGWLWGLMTVAGRAEARA